MMCIDEKYHSYPSVHAIFTVVTYMKSQLPRTFKLFEMKLRAQSKWVTVTLELQRFQLTFNDKYSGYKQETLRYAKLRQPYIPCMNPFFQDIYSDE